MTAHRRLGLPARSFLQDIGVGALSAMRDGGILIVSEPISPAIMNYKHILTGSG